MENEKEKSFDYLAVNFDTWDKVVANDFLRGISPARRSTPKHSPTRGREIRQAWATQEKADPNKSAGGSSVSSEIFQFLSKRSVSQYKTDNPENKKARVAEWIKNLPENKWTCD